MTRRQWPAGTDVAQTRYEMALHEEQVVVEEGVPVDRVTRNLPWWVDAT